MQCYYLITIVFFTTMESMFDARSNQASKETLYTNEPDVVRPVYHYPNQYELEPYKFWKENKPLPHYHGVEPEYGRLHQHFAKYGDVEEYKHFITDPPGIGLNNLGASHKLDNYESSDNNNHTSDKNNKNANSEPTSKYNNSQNVESLKSNDGEHSGGHSPAEGHHSEAQGTKVGFVDKDIVETDLQPFVKEKEAGDESNLNYPLHSELKGSSAPRSKPLIDAEEGVNEYNGESTNNGFVKPSSSYQNAPLSSYPRNGSSSYAKSSYNTFSSYGGCSARYGSCAPQTNCCGYPPPSCCLQLPQLPCCPRITIPCCPVQPICCQPIRTCGVCRSAAHRALRTKRFGCVPCIGRKKRSVLAELEEIHIRRKRLGCVPCLRKH